MAEIKLTALTSRSVARWPCAVFWLLLALGCGARTELADTTQTQETTCLSGSYDQSADFRVMSCQDTCTLIGTSERGEDLRFQCDRQGCQFFVDGVAGCTCNAPDYNNTCSNGVPLCQQRPNFNFTRVQFVPCASP